MIHFKRGLFLAFFLFGLIFVFAQEELPPTNVPGSDLLGEVNSETGRPANLEKFQEFGDHYVNQEQNKTFLYQEWTNLLANNPVMGPILFYTDQFFSFFDPLWKVIFGFEFSWSWAFFVGLFLWFGVAFVIYFPAKEMLHNKLFGFVTGFIVATITGFYDVLSTAIT
ncbi:hypothetical protein J4456_04015, partial [Candidatus Pacearchaeota archaeon]|nr:hypothetical protein [Candidatus Pacearchaeota archaeon]